MRIERITRSVVLATFGMLLTTSFAGADITTYTSRAAWLAAVGGTPDFEEDFQGFGADEFFQLAPVQIAGQTIEQVGPTFFRNQVDVPPFVFTDNNGTSHASCYVNHDEPGVQDETAVLFSPECALFGWGADFNSAGGLERIKLVLTQLDGTESSFEPDFIEGGPVDEFWGFTAPFDNPVIRVEIKARTLVTGGGGEGFTVDRIAGATTLTVDFETEDDFTTPLANGQHITSPPEFGNLVNVNGFGPHTYGTAIFDSTPGGPNAGGSDPDLLVDLGNVLILQENPTQSVPDIFDDPDDAQLGGTMVFDYVMPMTPASVDLIDICPGPPVPQDVTLTLTDVDGKTREYFVPGGWTNDRVLDGPPGFDTLDLTTLAPQPGFMATATASEDAGFDSGAVIRVEAFFASSGALDNLTCKQAVPAMAPVESCTILVGNAMGEETFTLRGVDWNTQLEEVLRAIPATAGAIPAFVLPIDPPPTPRGKARLAPSRVVERLYFQLLLYRPHGLAYEALTSQVLHVEVKADGSVDWTSVGEPDGIVIELETFAPVVEPGGPDAPRTVDSMGFRLPFRRAPEVPGTTPRR